MWWERRTEETGWLSIGNSPPPLTYTFLTGIALQKTSCDSLPIGATCQVELLLHDDAGRRFDSNEGVTVVYDVDMPHIVRVKLAPGNSVLELTGLAEGRAVVDVVASSQNGAPVTNYLLVNVESGLAPGERRRI